MVATVLPTKVKGGDENLVGENEDNENNMPKDSGCCKRNLCWQIVKLFTATVFLAFFLFLLAGQIFYFVNESEYDNVEVVLNFERPKYVTFPAITVCNNNPVQKSKFCKKYPEHCKSPSDNSQTYGEIIKSSAYYRLINNFTSADTIPLRQNWEDFAKTCVKVLTNREDNEECKFVTNIFYSLTYQNCFTFLRDNFTGDYRKAAFWLVLDFQPEENISNDTVVGGQLYIHDPDTRIPEGFPLSSHVLKPGKMYRFGLKQTNYYRFPNRDESGCKFYVGEDPFISSKEECYNKCLYDKFISSCECMPDVIPFFDISHSTRYCKSDNASRNCENTERNTIEDYCERLCPIKCREHTYQVKVDEFYVPTNLPESKKRMANIWVKFDTNEQLSYSEFPNLQNLDIRIYITCLIGFIVLLLAVVVIKPLVEMYRICKTK